MRLSTLAVKTTGVATTKRNWCDFSLKLSQSWNYRKSSQLTVVNIIGSVQPFPLSSFINENYRNKPSSLGSFLY